MESEEMMATRIARANGMPSVRILVLGTNILLDLIQLPASGGGNIDQRRQYRVPNGVCWVAEPMIRMQENGTHCKTMPLSWRKEPMNAPISSEGVPRQENSGTQFAASRAIKHATLQGITQYHKGEVNVIVEYE